MIDLLGAEIAPDERELLQHSLVGGVILFTRNYRDPAQIAALIADIHAARTPQLLVAVDHEGGRVQRFREGFSLLPPARRIGHEYDLHAPAGLELARRMGWLMAAELRARGVDLSFAPCVDLDYGLSEVIGDRAFHADAEVVSQLALAWMHGMRDAGMGATAKHFPSHGAVVADSHLALPVDRRELMDLEADLMPYRRLIANGLPSIMMSHVLFPAVDEVPASFSRRWIGEVLRGQLGFQGVIFSDDLSMRGAGAVGDIVQRARQALTAGCDMLPVCNDRAGVLTLLRDLELDPAPASQLRLVRLRGREALTPQALLASSQWRSSQESLARSKVAPAFTLEAGQA